MGSVMLRHRVSGVLLHPTSLPGPYGIGDLGDEALRFVEWLERGRQSLWQILPLGPTGYGDSPYAARSSFAGNPLLISLDRLAEAGDLTRDELIPPPSLGSGRIRFGEVISWKLPLLRRAAERFLDRNSSDERERFEAFRQAEAWWLDDFALYTAIGRHYTELSPPVYGAWNEVWERDLALRRPEALAAWRSRLDRPVRIEQVLQFRFFEQWRAVREHANRRGIRIIGDVPIFVALDSADVWVAPHLFRLDERLQPTHVAGVPPDAFSDDGQRWGNPLYDWDRMRADGFRWWLDRIAGARAQADLIRIDHFRGFAANWSIPADQPTAQKGEWTPAPGQELFDAMRRRFGELPFLAEDLGLITPDVEQLRVDNGFPGMKVLQFAFGQLDREGNAYLPHHHVPEAVVYTGTHDNDTTAGWYASISERERRNVADYLGHEPREVSWEFIRLAMASVARMAVVPMQDVLALGGEARMNRPSTDQGNWDWRVARDYADNDSAERLAELVRIFGRDEGRGG